MFKLTILLATVGLVGCSSRDLSASNSAPHHHIETPSALARDMKAVEPFFHPLPKPGPMDWLANNHEPGQTFEEYINEDPTLPTPERTVIYVQPLGDLNSREQKIVDEVADFLKAFYGLPVKELEQRSFDKKLSDRVFRMHDYPKHRQIKTGYILTNVLKPSLPPDAAAMIALTNEDLYPDDSMNFVFGQASLTDRVGVWSLYWLRDKYEPLFLTRVLKIASHETGHMFSMRHCTKYDCVMSGSNYLGETDSHPLDACPECMAKIAWLSKVAPVERYAKLEVVSRRLGLTDGANEFARKRDAVQMVKSEPPS